MKPSVNKFLQIAGSSDANAQAVYVKIAHSTFNQPLLNSNYKVQIALKTAENYKGNDSIDFFKQIIKEDPRNTNAYTLLALIYDKINKPNDAIEFTEKVN
jgi:Tfp pilus assembly protein PilF